MNIRKLFVAEHDGKIDKFITKLDDVQIKLLIQQLRDYLKNYERCCKNYTPEKMEKFGQPHIDRYMVMMNRLFKELEHRISI